MTPDYPTAYSRAITQAHPDVVAFLKAMHVGPGHDFDTTVSSILADWFQDRGHPLADLLRHQPRRIYENDFNSRRGGPGGAFAYFHPLATENGFHFGITGPDLRNNFAGLTLHAIPLNPNYKGRSEPRLTRQALWTRLWPYTFNETLGHTATKEFHERLPEGPLKSSLGALLADPSKRYLGGLFERDRVSLPEQPPQTDAEHQRNIHLDTGDDTHADRYGEWLQQQGDPVGDLIRNHVRRWGGQPTRHNQRSGLYSDVTWIDHRGGKIGIGEPRMYEGTPHVSLHFVAFHPSGEEYPRHPISNHLVPGGLSWSEQQPLTEAHGFADRLPEPQRQIVRAALSREPKSE